MEIDADGVCELVDVVKVAFLAVFRAGEDDACPGCVDMYFEGSVVLY